EFYDARAELTRRLITDHGFRGVAVEADWPASARVDRYVRGRGEDLTAEQALAGFVRFPAWIWRNPAIARLVDWLRDHGQGARFYGLDLYSLRESMSAVVAYLDGVDPAAAARARRRYGCFDGFDERAYGQAAARGEKDPCEDAVVAQLVELRQRAEGQEDGFAAEQNARLVADAERFYRAMYQGGPAGWNLRDTHMADTLDALRARHDRLVVWAHNSHVGDARATEAGMYHRQVSLGQLVRERHGDAAVRLVGFTTHTGTVTAAREWGGPAERRVLLPSLPGSVERLLHEAGIRRGVFDLRRGALSPDEQLIERMAGAVYSPETELWSHYMVVRPSGQFDLLVHIDETTALV
ncbi:MAG: erythromycin esterase family protein, partial [Actinobacteria bacterium]|nr:erythromycin esterase family protein [Actinomycetota bacterium]